jgi:hypothetical protein
VWATSEFQLSKGGLEIFEDLGRDDVGSERWPRALAAASFTAGGTETLSVSREAGHAGLTRFNPARLALSSRLLLLTRPPRITVNS